MLEKQKAESGQIVSWTGILKQRCFLSVLSGLWSAGSLNEIMAKALIPAMPIGKSMSPLKVTTWPSSKGQLTSKKLPSQASSIVLKWMGVLNPCNRAPKSIFSLENLLLTLNLNITSCDIPSFMKQGGP